MSSKVTRILCIKVMVLIWNFLNITKRCTSSLETRQSETIKVLMVLQRIVLIKDKWSLIKGLIHMDESLILLISPQ